MLQMTHNCSSTDPRDKVYGLLGLVGERLQNLIEIDYSQTVEEVMTRAAAAIIICREDFEILAYASLRARPAQKRLPTWVPDWAEYDGEITLRPQFQTSKIGPWTSLEKLMGSRSSDRRLSEIDWGAVVDIPASWPANLSSKPSVEVRGHCLATIDSTTKQEHGSSQWQDAQDFGDSLGALIEDHSTPKDFDMRLWPTRFQWLFNPSYMRLDDSQLQPDSTSAMKSFSNLHWAGLQQFCTELQTLGRNKYIFRAEYLPAITNHDFDVGDTVWAVDGCTVPLILRPDNHVTQGDAGRRSYTIVGDCYLFALSHMDCWMTSGAGLDQRWDFNPFRHMDALGTQNIYLH
jgi:hypothetical protein